MTPMALIHVAGTLTFGSLGIAGFIGHFKYRGDKLTGPLVETLWVLSFGQLYLASSTKFVSADPIHFYIVGLALAIAQYRIWSFLRGKVIRAPLTP